MDETSKISKSLDWCSGLSLFASIAIILILLSGCSHVPVMSMVKLSRLDPLATDPSLFRVAVRSPDWLRIAPGTALMHIGAERKDKPKEMIHETFQLSSMPISLLPPELADEMAGAEHVEILRVDPSDAPRLRSIQTKIKQLKKTHPDQIKGSLSVGVKGCVQGRGEPFANASARVTIYLKTSPAEAFFPLVRNVDLAKEEVGKAFHGLPSCSD